MAAQRYVFADIVQQRGCLQKNAAVAVEPVVFAEFIEHSKGKLGHLARMCFVILVTLTNAVQEAELLLLKLVGIIFAGFRADMQRQMPSIKRSSVRIIS